MNKKFKKELPDYIFIVVLAFIVTLALRLVGAI